MYLLSHWRRRQERPLHLVSRSTSGMNSTTIIALVVAIAALLGLALTVYLLYNCRRKHDNPKYIPTPFLKNLWRKWEPHRLHRLIPDSDGLEPHRSTELALPPTSLRSPTPQPYVSGATINTPATRTEPTPSTQVDRHTSVRSVMTLPAYNPNPLQNEQVLGREGERGGVDVVIEYPEGADEEEAAREAEMAALYQVRLARRRENEEREERRRLKREARERGDFVALRELQARSRNPSRSPGPSVEEARAEHERIKKARQRGISSVSYADLGIARHDGTRVRANSNDSEREGLLGNAANMGTHPYHRRDRSGSSVVSFDTINTELASGRPSRSRASSSMSNREDNSLHQVPSRSQPATPGLEGGAGSSPEMIEHDDVPPNSPPGYENISLDTENEGVEPPPGYSTSTVTTAEPLIPETPIVSTASVATAGRPTAVTVDSEGRRTSPSHVGQLILEMMPSSSSTASGPVSARTPLGEHRVSSGSRGSLQLQTLKLPTLPSIQIDPGTPATQSDHQPEE